MNVVGIVTEHNPYHNGHLYHVKKARELCDAEYVISVMSGHFLQRGEPALFNKWARAKMAVLGGVDMVLELPTAFASRSARAFAMGSVSLLEYTGVTTHLCFGSESGKLDELLPSAEILANEPADFRLLLKSFLGEGLSYPAARAGALREYITRTDYNNLQVIYNAPNNILGIEYLRSLISLGSGIIPFTIKRISAGYHDTNIRSGETIASATSIREELASSGSLTENVQRVVPSASFDIFKQEIDEGRGPVFLSNCTILLFYLLRTMSPSDLREIHDIGEGLENRILEASRTSSGMKDLIEMVKTKRYTWTRIQRIFSHILLGYTKEMAKFFDSTGPRYIRVLAMSGKGRHLLKKIKKNASVPVIIRTSNYLKSNDGLSSMLSLDVKATDIYSLLYPKAGVTRQGLDCSIMPYADD